MLLFKCFVALFYILAANPLNATRGTWEIRGGGLPSTFNNSIIFLYLGPITFCLVIILVKKTHLVFVILQRIAMIVNFSILESSFF